MRSCNPKRNGSCKTIVERRKKETSTFSAKEEKIPRTASRKSCRTTRQRFANGDSRTCQLLIVQIDSIEFAQIEQKVFQGLQQGNEVLKDLQGQMSIEDVENLMLDTQEAIEYQNVPLTEMIFSKLLANR